MMRISGNATMACARSFAIASNAAGKSAARPDRDVLDGEAQSARGGLRLPKLRLLARVHHIRQDGDSGDSRQGFLEQPQTFLHQLVRQEGDAGEVPARTREAADKLGLDRVAAEAEHDSGRPRRRLGAEDHRADRDDDVHPL
jgi:hypothetical protein